MYAGGVPWSEPDEAAVAAAEDAVGGEPPARLEPAPPDAGAPPEDPVGLAPLVESDGLAPPDWLAPPAEPDCVAPPGWLAPPVPEAPPTGLEGLAPPAEAELGALEPEAPVAGAGEIEGAV